MSESLTWQLLIFAYSCLLGVGLGILYDFFRIIRMMINPGYMGLLIQDIIYFVISGVLTFLFVLGFNYGETRFYIVAGEGIGWIIYHISLGTVIYKSSRKIVKYLNLKTNSFIFWIKSLFSRKQY